MHQSRPSQRPDRASGLAGRHPSSPRPAERGAANLDGRLKLACGAGSSVATAAALGRTRQQDRREARSVRADARSDRPRDVRLTLRRRDQLARRGPTSDVGPGGTTNVAPGRPSRWMGRPTRVSDHPAMDELKLQSRNALTIRSFRICQDRPQQPTTILGIVRSVAAAQATSGPSSRPVTLPRRMGVFA
jgi:hypothetical protein